MQHREPYGPKPLIVDGKVTKEKIHDQEIQKTLKTRVAHQTKDATWWDEDVELKDGRKVTIRSVTRHADD